MKHYAKPATDLGAIFKKADQPEDTPISDISVDRLLENGLTILHREMRNLLSLSSNGKLDSASARDLRETVKLLFEIKERELDKLKDLTDEQLAELAKESLHDSKQDRDPSGASEA